MLQNFVVAPFTEDAAIDYDLLEETISTAVRMLDNIIDINAFPSEIYSNYQRRYRTIGLGYTGLADMLVMLNYKYNSEEAVEFVHGLTEFIAACAYTASINLANEKGSFPGLDVDNFVLSDFLAKHCVPGSEHESLWKNIREDIRKYGIRNAKLLSVAPTGTMSMVYGNNCSSGIEPIFSLSYDRKVKMGGQSDDDIHIVTLQDYAYGVYNELKASGKRVISDPPFVTAMEMSVDEHVDMLAAIAYNVDMSVSKTINVPEDYPFEDCKEIYKKCWSNGIKGCTIFRPNPIRQGILIDKKNEEPEKEDTLSETEFSGLARGDIIECDDSLVGMKRKLTTGCGTMHLMAWFDPATGDIMETFVARGSSGGCEKNLTAMTRLISACLRGGIPFEYVIDQLDSCGGCGAYQTRRATKKDTSPGSSCATAIAKALAEMQKEVFADMLVEQEETVKRTEEIHTSDEVVANKPKCPDCGAEIEFEGGCNICKSCGWSKCG